MLLPLYNLVIYSTVVSLLTSTTQSLPLIEFRRLGLFTLRNGLPNKAKHNASNMVDLPEPFVPTTRVLVLLFSFSSVKWLPVERRFFQRRVLNIIIIFHIYYGTTNTTPMTPQVNFTSFQIWIRFHMMPIKLVR